MSRFLITISLLALSACANKDIAGTFADEPFVEAKVIGDPPPPVQVVEKVKPLPLPSQLKKFGAKVTATSDGRPSRQPRAFRRAGRRDGGR
jgi:hypothetical protein